VWFSESSLTELSLTSIVAGFSNRDTEHGGSSGSNVYCAGTDSVELSPKGELCEQRGLTLYTLKAVTEVKSKA
jgi:hypothetical protein